MNEHTAFEQAYKNGYEQGQRDAVKHGRWERYCDDKFMGYGANGKIKYRKVYTYECDNCGHGTAAKTNYCPNCGAKMDLEETDETD